MYRRANNGTKSISGVRGPTALLDELKRPSIDMEKLKTGDLSQEDTIGAAEL
jgi:hypothetical protein